MIDRRWWAALIVILGLGAGSAYVATRSGSPPATPATTSTPSTVSSSAAPVVGPCGRLRTARTGTTVTLSGDVSCDWTAVASGVTVTGTAKGALQCRRCDRWTFTRFALTGSLHMIGGTGWQILDSHLDGADAGLYGVLAVGQTPEAGNPTGWTVARTTIERPGNSPTHADNQDHALYVIAGNGVPLAGMIVDSTIRGSGAGAAVKLGGTGNEGIAGSSNAADVVTLMTTTVTNEPGPDATCVLLATASDDITLDRNSPDCPGPAVALDGPWTGTRTRLVGNTVNARPWLQVGYLRWGWFGPKDFQTFPTPADGCGRWAWCEANT